MMSPSLLSVPSSQPHTLTTAHSSSMFGNEEEEMDALLGEMMAAFPTQTTESKCAYYSLARNVAIISANHYYKVLGLHVHKSCDLTTIELHLMSAFLMCNKYIIHLLNHVHMHMVTDS